MKSKKPGLGIGLAFILIDMRIWEETVETASLWLGSGGGVIAGRAFARNLISRSKPRVGFEAHHIH
jgi:hypothetical protein